MRSMKQLSLAEMETVVPWSRLEALIEAHYPKKGNRRLPVPLSAMLRIHCLQQWFGYSDPAMEEALHDVPLLRQFAGLDPQPYQTTNPKMTRSGFRRFLSEHYPAIRLKTTNHNRRWKSH